MIPKAVRKLTTRGIATFQPEDIKEGCFVIVNYEHKIFPGVVIKKVVTLSEIL